MGGNNSCTALIFLLNKRLLKEVINNIRVGNHNENKRKGPLLAPFSVVLTLTISASNSYLEVMTYAAAIAFAIYVSAMNASEELASTPRAGFITVTTVSTIGGGIRITVRSWRVA